MTLVWIIVGILVAGFSSYWLFATEESPKNVVVSPTHGLSDPAKHLYKEYMELPEESRPFNDILSVLKGLDAATAHDTKTRKLHYDKNYYMVQRGHSRSLWGYEFSWNPEHMMDCCPYSYGLSSTTCEYLAYRKLHDEIVEVQKELKKRERALNLAGNSHNLDMANELAAALRSEREIQQQVVKELER